MKKTEIEKIEIKRLSKKFLRFIVFLFSILYFLFSILCLYAAFKDPGFAVRPLGMGGAFTAVSDDANAVIYNPAGIGQIEDYELSFMYSKLFYGLETIDLGLNYASVIMPFGWLGNYGISWGSFVSREEYKEDMVILTLAGDVNNVLQKVFSRDLLQGLFFGINIKYLQHSFTLDQRSRDDPVFSNAKSKGEFTADAGVLSFITEDFSVGLGLKNITQPDLGLKTQDIVPMETRLGLAYIFYPNGFIGSTLIDFDVMFRNQTWGSFIDKLNFYLGSETWFWDDMLAFRVGGNYTEVAVGLSFKTPQTIKFAVQLDIGFVYPLYVQGTSGSYRIGLVLRLPTKSD